MTEKNEALRLADSISRIDTLTEHQRGELLQAAAELRRLHGLDFALRDCELALNKMATKYMDASDQRDALLGACKAYDQWADKTFCYDRELRPIRAQIRAAIKNAEGEKT